MDFLNQAIAQIRELFVSMTPAARVTAMLLIGVIGVSLGFLVQQQGAGPDDYLFNGEFLPPADAQRVEAAIAKAGLNGWERVGNRFKVPRGQKAAYLAAVAEDGALPLNFHQLLEDALDLGPFVDARTRGERLKAAREQQLSMIVRSMHGIENAQVMYEISPPRGLAKEGFASATVSVQPKPGEPLAPEQVKRIRNAVAGAIANLHPEEVQVINLAGDNGWEGEISPEAFDSPYYKARIGFERQMKDKIHNLLSYIPAIRVQVTAELERALTRETQTTSVESEPVAMRETRESRQNDTQHFNPGGRPGLIANGPNGKGPEPANETTAKAIETNESSETNSFIPTKNEQVTEAGLVPETVRVAIAVPQNYLVQMYREKQRRNGEDLTQPLPPDIDTILTQNEKTLSDQITKTVATLLPKELAVNNFPNVHVTFFESLTPEPIEPTPTRTKALVWMSQHFGTITMAGIAMVSLVMLRSLVKAIPPADPLASSQSSLLSLSVPHVERGASRGEGASDGESEEERPRLKLKKGKTLRDELTDIVREDPDSAAAILKSWINNAA